MSSTDKIREDSAKTFDRAKVVLLSDVLPKEDKKELHKQVVDLERRSYELPGAAKKKYDQ